MWSRLQHMRKSHIYFIVWNVKIKSWYIQTKQTLNKQVTSVRARPALPPLSLSKLKWMENLLLLSRYGFRWRMSLTSATFGGKSLSAQHVVRLQVDGPCSEDDKWILRPVYRKSPPPMEALFPISSSKSFHLFHLFFPAVSFFCGKVLTLEKLPQFLSQNKK